MTEVNISTEEVILQDEMTAGEENVTRRDEKEEKVTYTAEEVRALLQSEGDRRVSGARRKWEREMGEEIAAAAKEQALELTTELSTKAEELQHALDEANAKMARRERELTILRSLDERGLPKTFLPLLMSAGEGEEGEIMDTLSAAICDEASRMVRERLSSPAPKVVPKKRLPTSEEYRTLPVATLQEMLR